MRDRKDKLLEDIIHSVALKYNLQDKVVKEIEESVFNFIRMKMKETVRGDLNTFKNYRVINLGLFYTDPGIIEGLIRKSKKIKELKKLKENGVNNTP